LIDEGALEEQRVGKYRFVHRESLAKHFGKTSAVIAKRIRSETAGAGDAA